MRDAIVIGAGIAGLAAAWELRSRGVEPLVLEQSRRAGGVILTERVGGFVIDGGPDALLAQKPAALELCRELGIDARLIPTLPPRTAFVLRRGRLTPLPAASFLGLPTRLPRLLASPLFSWAGKLRMAAELLIPPARGTADESIGDFIRRRFGHEALTYLGEPLLAGIHAGDPDRLSVHALFPRLVEAEREHGSVLRMLLATRARQAEGAAFVSFPEGLDELVRVLIERLGPGAVRYGARVGRIERGTATGSLRVCLDSGETIATAAVIVAVPAWAAAPLLASLDPPLATLCAGIPYASSATVVCGFTRDQVGHPLRGTGFVSPRRERRTVLAATWVSSKWPRRAPDGHVLLRGFVGGATDPDALAAPDDELIDRTAAELAPLLDIVGPPVMSRVYRWIDGTPQYQVGHLDRVRQIDQRLAQTPGVFLTGSGYRGTGIPDCIADARANAARAAATVRAADRR